MELRLPPTPEVASRDVARIPKGKVPSENAPITPAPDILQPASKFPATLEPKIVMGTSSKAQAMKESRAKAAAPKDPNPEVRAHPKVMPKKQQTSSAPVEVRRSRSPRKERSVRDPVPKSHAASSNVRPLPSQHSVLESLLQTLGVNPN